MGSGIEYDPENDFYKVLGVTAQTDSKEIKKAYYKLAHKYHPDKAGEKHAEKFKQISAAWEVIGDPDSRKLYDSAKKSYSSGADYGYSAHKESYAHKHNHKNQSSSSSESFYGDFKTSDDFNKHYSNFTSQQQQAKGKDFNFNSFNDFFGTKRAKTNT